MARADAETRREIVDAAPIERAIVAPVAPHARAFAFFGIEHDDGVRFRRAGFHPS
jgi:hypothetical protein